MKPEIENYGFAEDIKTIAQSQTELKAGATDFEMCCKENQMKLSATNCKLLNLRGQLSESPNKTNLKEAPAQRSLGHFISSNLNWT